MQLADEGDAGINGPVADAAASRCTRCIGSIVELADHYRAGPAIAACTAFFATPAMQVFAQIVEHRGGGGNGVDGVYLLVE